MATPLDQLRWSLQALAAPVEQQVQLFPTFVCVPDELVLDFDEWHRATTNENFTATQRDALTRLDEHIAAWSGPEHADVWTDTALVAHPIWKEIRARAAEALTAFNWPAQIPPSDRGATYVRGKSE